MKTKQSKFVIALGKEYGRRCLPGGKGARKVVSKGATKKQSK